MPLIENDEVRAIIGTFVLVLSLIGGFSCIVWCVIDKEINKKNRRITPIIVMHSTPKANNLIVEAKFSR